MILDRLRTLYRRCRVRRRRQKLISVYAKEFRIRHDKGPGISPIMHAYDRLQQEGLATIVVIDDDQAELVWHWPEDETPEDA